MQEFFLLLILASGPDAMIQENQNSRQAACMKVKEQLRNVESRMRAGYTRAEGERLEARRRKLRKKRFRLCR